MPVQPLKKLKKGKFPKIPRFIPEAIHKKEFLYAKILLFSIITTVLLVMIILRSYDIFRSTQAIRQSALKSKELVSEMHYWQKVVASHPGYRDADFRLAVLAYQLGDKNQAREYLGKSLQIDPDFKAGRDFAKVTGLNTEDLSKVK